MSVKHNDSEYTCDLCGKKEFGRIYPGSFSNIRYEGKRGGFVFYGGMDICKECAPDSFFRDPPQTVTEKGFVSKLFDVIKRRRPSEQSIRTN